MKAEDFKQELIDKLKEPTQIKDINLLISAPQSNGTIHRFINALVKNKTLVFITSRNFHPKRKPVKFYFINPIKNHLDK